MLNLINRFLFKIKKPKLSKFFPKHLFWDVNMDNLDFKRDKTFIIERVLNYHMEQEDILRKLEKLYSINDIKKIAINSSQIFGNETIDFLCKRYKLNPKNFTRYIFSIKEES